MSFVVERSFEPIAVSKSGDRLELRIQGSGPEGQGSRSTWLSAKEARILAYELLQQAEKLSP